MKLNNVYTFLERKALGIYHRGFYAPVSKFNMFGERATWSLYAWFRSFFPESWHYLDCLHTWGKAKYHWSSPYSPTIRCSRFETCIKCGRARNYSEVPLSERFDIDPRAALRSKCLKGDTHEVT